MGVSIHTIPLGFDNVYVVKDQGVIIIDGGNPQKGKTFLNGLKKAAINPNEIQLIILTHGHWDHIGSACDIRELTGAKIVMHENEKHLLEGTSKPKMPPGVTLWGKITTKLMTWFVTPFIHIRQAKVDIVLDNNEFPLNKYGISGSIVYTPGHSPGSVSVLLNSGEAFVGDSAMNKFPLRLTPGFPIYAENWPILIESWKMLAKKNIKTIFPAHGNPFSFDIIREKLDSVCNRSVI